MRKITAVLVLIPPVLSLLLAIPARADKYTDAMTFYMQGDFDNAYRLIKPLAEQGHAIAQYRIGRMYNKGRGVRPDIAEAAKWYRKAAEQGHANAQYNLGDLYRKGQGVPLDLAETVKWFRKAAEQGHADAQYNLGDLYKRGIGVPQDFIMAHTWLDLAALNYTDSERSKVAASVRDTVASGMTPAQIAKAQKLAREWKPKKER